MRCIFSHDSHMKKKCVVLTSGEEEDDERQHEGMLKGCRARRHPQSTEKLCAESEKIPSPMLHPRLCGVCAKTCCAVRTPSTQNLTRI